MNLKPLLGQIQNSKFLKTARNVKPSSLLLTAGIVGLGASAAAYSHKVSTPGANNFNPVQKPLPSLNPNKGQNLNYYA